MRHPTRDQLTAAALPGEPTDADVTAHLAECPACAAEVAALGRTVGLARDGLALDAAPPPPPSVWAGILDRLDDDLPAEALRDDPRHDAPDGVAAGPSAGWRRVVVASGLALVAALAVVAVLLGGSFPGPDVGADRAAGPGPGTTARVALVSADPGVGGEAVMGPGPAMHVDVVVPGGVPAGADLEVWAVEPGGMRSLGVLDPAPDRIRWTGDLAVVVDPAQRPALDVSVEPEGTGPEHSGHSIAHAP